MKKKTISIILTMLFIINAFTVTAFADNSGVAYIEPIELYNGSLQSQQDFESSFSGTAFRDYLISNIQHCNEEINISSYNIPASSGSELLEYIIHSIPEAFNILLSSGMKMSTTGTKIYSIYLSYNCSSNEYSNMINQFKNKVNKLLGDIKSSSLNDYQKALLIHDRLINNCTYTEDTLHCYDAYGALVEGKAVCQGYTLAYMYLLNEVGIDNYFCNSSSLKHAWNIVKINDKYYHSDATWDDPTNGLLGTVSHDYFLLSTSAFRKSHNATDYDTTPTDTRFDNYFWANSNTEFQLVNNNIYYIEKSTGALKKWNLSSSDTTITTITDKWQASATSTFTGCYSKLSSDGKDLFFSTKDKIKKYTISNNSITTVLTPSLTNYYWIYGFKYQDGNLLYVIYNNPLSSQGATVVTNIYPYTEMVYTVGIKNNKLSYLCNGEVCTDFSDVITYNGKTYLVINGLINTSTDSVVELNGNLYHVKNSEIDQNEEPLLISYNNTLYYFKSGIWTKKTCAFEQNGKRYLIKDGVVYSGSGPQAIQYGTHIYIVNANGTLYDSEMYTYLGSDTTTVYHVKKGILTYSLTHASDPAQKITNLISMIIGEGDCDYLYDFSRDEELNILDLVCAKKELSK